MKKWRVKTFSVVSLLPALYSLYTICTRLGWEFNPSPNDPESFEVKLPAEDEHLWDFIMDGLE